MRLLPERTYIRAMRTRSIHLLFIPLLVWMAWAGWLAGCGPQAQPPPEPPLPEAESAAASHMAEGGTEQASEAASGVTSAAIPVAPAQDVSVSASPEPAAPEAVSPTPEDTEAPAAREGGAEPETAAATPPEAGNADTPTDSSEVQPESPEKPQEQASTLKLDTLLRISEGMTYDEIRTILGEPGVRVAGNAESGEIYRWSAGGLSFTARIEDGKLVRKRILEDGKPVRAPGNASEKPLDQAIYDAIREGMTYDQVLAILGMDPQPVLKPGTDVVVYRWSDASGASFTARFENGVLVRKYGLYLLPRPSEQDAAEATTDSAAEDSTPEPQESAETSRPKRAETPADRNGAPAAADQDTGAEEAEDQEVSSVPAEISPTDERSEPEDAGPRMDQPSPEESKNKRGVQRVRRASLPRFAHRLRSGSYEIRVNNLSDSDVEAALLSDTGGLRLKLRAGASESVKVPEGNYVLYFIYDKEPETLNRGGIIPVSEWRTDVDVFLIGESYDVRALERSGEPASRRRRR